MKAWSILGKTTSFLIISMLSIGTCCIGFSDAHAHEMHMQNMHAGTVITCADNSHDTNSPCGRTGDSRILVANTPQTVKTDFLLEQGNDTPSPPLISEKEIPEPTLDLSKDESSFPIKQKQSKWVTALPRSHLS